MFEYLFAKNDRNNIEDTELVSFRALLQHPTQAGYTCGNPFRNSLVLLAPGQGCQARIP